MSAAKRIVVSSVIFVAVATGVTADIASVFISCVGVVGSGLFCATFTSFSIFTIGASVVFSGIEAEIGFGVAVISGSSVVVFCVLLGFLGISQI